MLLNKYKLIYKKGGFQISNKLQIESITKVNCIYFYENINY